MSACKHCAATESACQWRDGCCEYCNHVEGCDLNATDPAAEAWTAQGVLVRALADAHIGNPDHDCAVCRMEADDILSRLRPIIEAEVRERIAADIEAYADDKHVHVESRTGLCAILDGDRCDITAAYRHAARIARGAS